MPSNDLHEGRQVADSVTLEKGIGLPHSLPNRASRRCAASGSNRSPQTYVAYIKSDAWRCSPARLAELLASGGRCRLCNEGRPTVMLTVHHRTYERLGREEADDLTTLCEPCHDVVTDMLRDRAISDRPLPVPVDLPRYPRTLVDSVEKDGR